MIFVTVGTTLPFDALLREVDRLKGAGSISEEVICQTGSSAYIPINCQHFRYKPDLEQEIAAARVVIGHGGTGTVLSLLSRGKPFIALANPVGDDDHQCQFLQRLSQTYDFLWSENASDLERLLQHVKPGARREVAPTESLAAEIRRVLLGKH